jgi:hypothetical protein
MNRQQQQQVQKLVFPPRRAGVLFCVAFCRPFVFCSSRSRGSYSTPSTRPFNLLYSSGVSLHWPFTKLAPVSDGSDVDSASMGANDARSELNVSVGGTRAMGAGSAFRMELLKSPDATSARACGLWPVARARRLTIAPCFYSHTLTNV